MNTTGDIEEVLYIAEKFTKHLESLSRMVAYDELIVNEYANKGDNESLEQLINLIINVKSLRAAQTSKGIELQEDDLEVIQLLDDLTKKSVIAKYFTKHISVSNDDGGYEIHISSSFVDKAMKNTLNNSNDLSSDINHLLNSTIISLVTGMELLIAEIFKDFMQNVDQSKTVNDRSLTLADLTKIGSVEDARIFLIDEYIESLLRQSFTSWIDEFNKKIKINIMKHPLLSSEIDNIIETFQRRHLLIHNGGEVNDLYLAKVNPNLTSDISKGDVLENNAEYILESIERFRIFGIVLVFEYGIKKYRGNKDELFEAFNNLLLKLSTIGCTGARSIYKDIFSNKEFNHANRLVSEINYYLSHRLNNDFDLVESEVKKFDVSTLSDEFKMAKFLLLEEFEEALIHFEAFCSKLSDDYFITIIDWPLLKKAKDREGFKDYIDKRIDSIISEEGAIVNEN